MVSSWINLLVFTLNGLVTFSSPLGDIYCECTTEECQREGRTTCTATTFCYVQYLAVPHDAPYLVRGCIDEGTPLLCENHRPQNLNDDTPWPVLFCCNNASMCNKGVIPTIPSGSHIDFSKLQHYEGNYPHWDVSPEHGNDQNNPSSYQDYDSQKTLDANIQRQTPSKTTGSPRQHDANTNGSDSRRRTGGRINPIYIAVPAAGVCVLLALVIFAIYLLKRRNVFSSERYPYNTPVMEHEAQRPLPIVRGCVDSERLSSGSETKLFIQT